MTVIDTLLENWRMRMCQAWLPPNANILDIGCRDGTFLQKVSPRIRSGIGIDPLIREACQVKNYRLLPGCFPQDFNHEGQPLDIITLIATIEHVPREQLPAFMQHCQQWLRPGGRLVMTMPSPPVDDIVAALVKIRLMEGMSLEEHYGLEVPDVLDACRNNGFKLIAHRTFQLGLNHLMVLERHD